MYSRRDVIAVEWWWLRLSGRNMLEWLNNNKLINPKLIYSFCWFVLFFNYENARSKNQNKGKGLPQQVEVAQGVPGRLRPRIFLTFGSTRVVGRQPYARANFTPREIPGTHFQRLRRSQDTWFRWGEPRKKSPVTPSGIDPTTVRLVAQCLNHYAIPGPK